MRWPLYVLAVPTVGLGLAIGWFPDYLGDPLAARSSAVLGPGPLPSSLTPQPLEALVALGLVILGAGGTYLIWRGAPTLDPARVLGRGAAAARRGLYLDEIQHALVVQPYRRLASAMTALDQTGVDGLVDGAAEATATMSRGLSRAHPRLPNLAVTSLIVSTMFLVAILAFFA